MLLLDPSALRRALILAMLLAVLLFGWQPSARPLSRPPQRRETDRPLPDSSVVRLWAARVSRSTRAGRPLPSPRQAARRRRL
jgi:hypothetical protein